MAWRTQFGDLGGGAFGCRISKPGIDVTMSQPGQRLFDSSSIAYQKVLSGNTIMAQNQGAGTYTKTVSLPGEYASYSNLIMWANLYEEIRYTVQDPAGGNVDRDVDLTNDPLNTIWFGVSSGVLYLTIAAQSTAWFTNANGNTRMLTIRSSWAIFNARVS